MWGKVFLFLFNHITQKTFNMLKYQSIMGNSFEEEMSCVYMEGLA